MVDFDTRRRGREFAGSPTLEERARLLAGCHGATKCGFLAASSYDALANEAAARSAHCSLVVLTAVFGRKDKLQQPAASPRAMDGCFFAVVDAASKRFLISTAPKSLVRSGDVSKRRIGAWSLLTLDMASSPYASARRASRVPKLLPFRLFPHSNYSLWVDGKLKLLADPMALVERFLLRPGAQLALARNLRRDHIDEEVRWIRKELAATSRAEEDGTADQKISAAAAAAVEAQWRFYEQVCACACARAPVRPLTCIACVPRFHEREQEQQGRRRPRDGGGNGGGRGSDSYDSYDDDDEEEEDGGEAEAARWTERTACAEGAMVLMRLQSGLARCAMCAWFGEWHRFGERDQLSLSYVLYSLGLTPPMPEEDEEDHRDGAVEEEASAALAALSSMSPPPPPTQQQEEAQRHRGVYLWPRHEHWQWKPQKKPRAKGRRPKRQPYVKYMGHGGCTRLERSTKSWCG